MRRGRWLGASPAVNIVTSGATHTSSSHAFGPLHFISLLRYFTEILSRIHWLPGSPCRSAVMLRKGDGEREKGTCVYAAFVPATIPVLPTRICTVAPAPPVARPRELAVREMYFLSSKHGYLRYNRRIALARRVLSPRRENYILHFRRAYGTYYSTLEYLHLK